ncbi:MAG: DUF433 domain-containing protein [Ferruginibacter sp.]|nr:DUF433 domain-containing protein [Cytophagales bacterium]
MDNHELLNRIELNPRILTGKPVIKGTRLSVQFIVGLLARGVTHQQILDEYACLKTKDIYACLLFASQMLKRSTFVPLEKSLS